MVGEGGKDCLPVTGAFTAPWWVLRRGLPDELTVEPRPQGRGAVVWLCWEEHPTRRGGECECPRVGGSGQCAAGAPNPQGAPTITMNHCCRALSSAHPLKQVGGRYLCFIGALQENQGFSWNKRTSLK